MQTSEDVIRVKTDLVVCDVVVLDEQKRIVKNLQKDDFLVKEDGQPQTLSHFYSGEGGEMGRSIVLIIFRTRLLRSTFLMQPAV